MFVFLFKPVYVRSIVLLKHLLINELQQYEFSLNSNIDIFSTRQKPGTLNVNETLNFRMSSTVIILCCIVDNNMNTTVLLCCEKTVIDVESEVGSERCVSRFCIQWWWWRQNNNNNNREWQSSGSALGCLHATYVRHVMFYRTETNDDGNAFPQFPPSPTPKNVIIIYRCHWKFDRKTHSVVIFFVL